MNGELDHINIREKAGSEPLTNKDKNTVSNFIKIYNKNIIQKWVKFFVMKQNVRSTIITKKI